MNGSSSPAGAADLSDLPGIISKQDQRRAFQVAKRHTVIARILKYLLPLISLAIVGLYFIPNNNRPVSLDLPVSIEGVDLDSQGLKMINPSYSGGDEKLGRYKIEAEYALQQITNINFLQLHKIAGMIEQPDNKWTKITATKGTYDTKSEQMVLQEGVVITSNHGMQADLQSADIDMKKRTIISDKPVRMKLNENIVNAASMTLNTAQKRVLFSGGVKVKLIINSPMTKMTPQQ